MCEAQVLALNEEPIFTIKDKFVFIHFTTTYAFIKPKMHIGTRPERKKEHCSLEA
ncbi:hypothetical protein LCGC14_0745720 [marine sediment metagenome]|uniref:Uncharacterized protein n=1 Tax=marine sediment metagenome TaxID=412755 RepID=A0A0F9SQH3_9ZZZZ